MGRASIIEAYIQQLLAWNKPITSSIIKAIAEEIGITQGELDAIKHKVQSHLARSHNYREFDDLDRAINELNQAQALDPVNGEVLYTLAETYSQRYHQDSRVADKQQALMTAKRCVDLWPNDKDALTLVHSLEGNQMPAVAALQTKPNIFILIGFLENVFSPKKISRRTKTKIALLILFLQQPVQLSVPSISQKIALVMGGVAAVGIGFIGVDRLPGVSNSVLDSVLGSTFSESKDAADLKIDDADAPNTFDPGPNVPVAFNHPGLLIEPRMSRLGKYNGDAYYKLHGIVINDSGQEVLKLNLKVELLDGDGEPISTINQVSVTGTDTIIRPGDTRSFRLFHKITPNLISVRVSVLDIEQVVELAPDELPAAPGSRLKSIGSEIKFDLASWPQENDRENDRVD
ncbi:MAG: hypothetical protein AAGF93_04850 [Cyanobacteria bacterium P01_H01_bin.105]